MELVFGFFSFSKSPVTGSGAGSGTGSVVASFVTSMVLMKRLVKKLPLTVLVVHHKFEQRLRSQFQPRIEMYHQSL